MQLVTLLESMSGTYRHSPCTGGRGQYVSADYRIDSDPAQPSVIFSCHPESDEETLKWYPHLLAGLEEGLEVVKSYYQRQLVGLHMVIIKVKSHPVDTSIIACHNWGRYVISDLARYKALPLVRP